MAMAAQIFFAGGIVVLQHIEQIIGPAPNPTFFLAAA
jgi:hypothetical protein